MTELHQIGVTVRSCDGPSSCGGAVHLRELLVAGPHLLGDVVDPSPLLLGDVGGLHPVYVAVGDYLRPPVADDSSDTHVWVAHRLVCPLKATILDRLTATPQVAARMARNSREYRTRRSRCL